MAKDRDWVDYVSVAANTVQAGQLHGINSKMRELAELELLKESREQHEGAVEKCEDLLRDAVFVYSEQLRDLDEVSTQTPGAAYIRANHLKRLYTDIPHFKASGFRRFEDKERLANVQRSCDRLIRDSAARLKPDDLENCKRCVDHIFERDELLRLIPVAERRAKLAEYKATLPAKQAANAAEYESVKAQQQQNKKPFWLPICEGIIVLLLGTIGLIVSSAVLLFCTGNQQSIDQIVSRYLIGLVAGLVGMIAVVVILLRIKKNCSYMRRRNELAKQGAALTSDLAAMTRGLADKEAEINQNKSLFTKFGTTRTEDLKTRLSERDALLMTILGDYAKDFIERKQPVVATTFDIVLVTYPVPKQAAINQALNSLLIYPELLEEGVLAKSKPIDSGVPNCLFTGISETLAKTVRDTLIHAGAEVVISPVIDRNVERKS